jgi:hypothetical protein
MTRPHTTKSAYAHALALAFITASTVSVMAAPPAYVGNWAPDAGLCDPAEPLVQLKARYLGLPDTECKFTSVSGGGGVWKVRATCQGEGSKPAEQMTIRATKKKLSIKYAGDARLWTYVRCK